MIRRSSSGRPEHELYSARCGSDGGRESLVPVVRLQIRRTFLPAVFIRPSASVIFENISRRPSTSVYIPLYSFFRHPEHDTKTPFRNWYFAPLDGMVIINPKKTLPGGGEGTRSLFRPSGRYDVTKLSLRRRAT